MAVYVGTCGWSYPRGEGKWDDVFYPRGLADREKLAYYAERFDAVEVNSSFYRPLPASMAQTWVARTRPDFKLCVKLYQKFTHPKMFEEASGEAAGLSDSDYETAYQGLEPLAASGKLGALLAQFPPSFKAEPASQNHLENLIRRFRQYPLAVELRHRGWSDSEQVRELLEEYGVAWTMIDEPKFRTSIREVPLTSRLGYFRFHGRNYEQWWKGDRETRYNYLYTPAEQQALAADVTEVTERTTDTYAFYNNHYRAKAVVNALELKQQLGQPIGVSWNDELLREYPELREIVGEGSAARSDPPA